VRDEPCRPLFGPARLRCDWEREAAAIRVLDLAGGRVELRPATAPAILISALQRTLEEAVDAFEDDRLTLDVFGPAMHEAWIDFKREE
jgi:hypothetical protein